ncbi:MAG: ABC transporter permease DevC [Leptolyngbyaceae bacterium]|nr:ABC transporter permease DevC [Leptolyngbyaceae bacterium]
MRTPLAWLNLVHERTRLLVAIAGVTFAILLIFMNLGFLGALSLMASQVYGQMNADIFLISPKTLEITTAEPFPIERIYQAAGITGVHRTMPLYVGFSQWRNPETRINRAIFCYGFNLRDPVFKMPELNNTETLHHLQQPHTVLIDRQSRPEFGPQTVGTRTEMDRRAVEVIGHYSLGGGFAADGTVILSDTNYSRYLAPRPLDIIDFGLIQVEDGVDPQMVVNRLKAALPADVNVLTQTELINRERDYWITNTSIGFIFSLGVVVALIVGVVIVYQVLYTDISNHMKEYSTLKAMGYPAQFLFKVVLQEALILAVLGYIPGFAIALGLYEMTLKATAGSLPVSMTPTRAIFVFGLAIVMCSLSGLVSVNKAVRADPADVF